MRGGVSAHRSHFERRSRELVHGGLPSAPSPCSSCADGAAPPDTARAFARRHFRRDFQPHLVDAGWPSALRLGSLKSHVAPRCRLTPDGHTRRLGLPERETSRRHRGETTRCLESATSVIVRLAAMVIVSRRYFGAERTPRPRNTRRSTPRTRLRTQVLQARSRRVLRRSIERFVPLFSLSRQLFNVWTAPPSAVAAHHEARVLSSPCSLGLAASSRGSLFRPSSHRVPVDLDLPLWMVPRHNATDDGRLGSVPGAASSSSCQLSVPCRICRAGRSGTTRSRRQWLSYRTREQSRWPFMAARHAASASHSHPVSCRYLRHSRRTHRSPSVALLLARAPHLGEPLDHLQVTLKRRVVQDELVQTAPCSCAHCMAIEVAALRGRHRDRASLTFWWWPRRLRSSFFPYAQFGDGGRRAVACDLARVLLQRSRPCSPLCCTKLRNHYSALAGARRRTEAEAARRSDIFRHVGPIDDAFRFSAVRDSRSTRNASPRAPSSHAAARSVRWDGNSTPARGVSSRRDKLRRSRRRSTPPAAPSPRRLPVDEEAAPAPRRARRRRPRYFSAPSHHRSASSGSPDAARVRFARATGSRSRPHEEDDRARAR